MTSHVDSSPQRRQTQDEALAPKVTLAEVIVGGVVLAMAAWVVLPEVSRAADRPQQAGVSRAAQAASADPQRDDVRGDGGQAGAEDTVTQTTETGRGDSPAQCRQSDREARRPADDSPRRPSLGAHRTR